MTALARVLEGAGFTLRSGGARGADFAFACGVQARAEIYVPTPDFELSIASASLPRISFADMLPNEVTRHYEIAAKHHPAWSACSPFARACHARNVLQVLGPGYVRLAPSLFVLCWTSDGKATGGTGQAIRIAQAHRIPVYNLHDPAVFVAARVLVLGDE